MKNTMERDCLRTLLQGCFRRMVGAVDPARLVRASLSLKEGRLLVGGQAVFSLEGKRLWLVALGKAAGPMAQAAQEICGACLKGGLVIAPQLLSLQPPLKLIQGEHPQPGSGSLLAGRALERLCRSLGAEDILLVLLSGGGSSLAVLPREGLTLKDIRVANQALLGSPLGIGQVNAVRKALDRLKGGGLARTAAPAAVVQLILSDVVGDDLGTIASGPFIPQDTPCPSLLQVLRQAGVEGALPSAVIHALAKGDGKEAAKGPKMRVNSFLIGNNRMALRAGKAWLEERGFPGLILSSSLEGELGSLVRFHAQVLRETLAGDQPLPPPCALLSGGESFLRVSGNGRGGRNQEFALRFLLEMAGQTANWALLSAGTDGVDGNSPAAGAIILGGDLDRARAKDLDAGASLDANDSYGFFRRSGGVLQSGPTGTNVADVRVMLAWPDERVPAE